MTLWVDPSKWLKWFRAFDWSHANNVLGSIVAVTVLVGIAWTFVKFVLNPLADWLGRRRKQAKLLDQLACGSSVAYVESLFGAAQFITFADEREQRTYHLPGAWVMVELENSRAIAFSVTVTDRRMFYNTSRLTRGFVDIDLGKQAFGEPGNHCNGEQFWIAAYRYNYARAYYVGRFGAYLTFILSYNMSGAGAMKTSESAATGVVETGAFSQTGEPRGLVVDSARITANTLTVIHPDAKSREFLDRNIHGPDESQVKMAMAIRPPDNRTLRVRFRYWQYQLKAKCQKLGGPFQK